MKMSMMMRSEELKLEAEVEEDTDLIFLHLRGHHAQELSELDHTIAVLIKLVDQVLNRLYNEEHKEKKPEVHPRSGFLQAFS